MAAARSPEPGYERPAPIAHPADLAAGAWELARVRGLRARGVPWPHIARQVGKCERALRATYAPLLGEAAPEIASAAAPARPRPPLALRLLAAMEATPGLTPEDLAGGDDLAAVRRALTELRQAGHARNLGAQHAGCWITTAAGRARLAREAFDA